MWEEKIRLLRKLIKVTENEAELKDLNAELDTAIGENAKEELRAEQAKEAKEAADKKAVEEAKAKSKMAKVPEQTQPTIKVGTPDNYRGYNLKAGVGMLQEGVRNAKHKERARKDPDRAELAVKFFADKMADAKMLTPEAMKNMNEGTTTAGGYLTPTEERLAVLSYIRDVSIALPDCDVVPMQSDSMTIPRENGKVTLAYTAEAANATETSAVFDQVTLTAKRLDGYADVTNELIMDDAKAPGGIVGLLTSQFTEALGQKIDSTVFLGTGDPISGVFLSAGASEVFDSGSTHFSELLESNVRNVIALIRPNRRAGAKWYMSTSVLWQYFTGLKDSDGQYLFKETQSDGGSVINRLWGYPVREGNDDIMKSTSAVSTAMAVFGNLQGFMIGERLGQMSLFVDPYSLSAKFMTRYLSFTRWGFAHALPLLYAKIETPAS